MNGLRRTTFIAIMAGLAAGTLGGQAVARDMDVLNDVTMQVLDVDQDLTKAIPRVIEIPQSKSDRGRGSRLRREAPPPQVEAPAAPPSPPRPLREEIPHPLEGVLD